MREEGAVQTLFHLCVLALQHVVIVLAIVVPEGAARVALFVVTVAAALGHNAAPIIQASVALHKTSALPLVVAVQGPYGVGPYAARARAIAPAGSALQGKAVQPSFCAQHLCLS